MTNPTDRSPSLGDRSIPDLLRDHWALLSDSDAKTLRTIAMRLLVKSVKALKS